MSTLAQNLKLQIAYWNGYTQSSGADVWAQPPAPTGWVNSAFCGKGEQVIWARAGSGPEPLSSWAMYPYVPNIVNDARKAGRWITSYQSHTYDLVTFDWANSAGRRDGLADHVGMIINNNPNLPYVDTFEFNTTRDGGAGEPRGAYFRRRYRADILGCVNRQPELGRIEVGQPPTGRVLAPTAQNLNLWLDAAHIRTLQTVLGLTGTAVDGVAGPVTYKALQTALGTPADGVLTGGFSTAVKQLQIIVHVTPDGVLGPNTGKALESYLDAGGTFISRHPIAPPVKQPVPPVSRGAERTLAVDGIFGKSSTLRAQSWLGTPADGVISSQDPARKANFPVGNWTTVQWVSNAGGSTWVGKLQAKLGVKADNILGPATAKALQTFLGFKGKDVDGIAGIKTVKAFQTYLNSH